MCGIVGCAGNLFMSDFKAFRDMLCFDVVRGQDSTGVVRIPATVNAKPEVVKELGHPMNLWTPEDKQGLFDDRGVVKWQSKCLIGHNRAATIGDVNKENAHPFIFEGDEGHVYGVHNGTLWTYNDLEGDHDIDSKAIYQTIADKGIDHCWENLCGAAALVWWDQDTQRLYMIRNDKRPLYIRETGRGSLYWASEPWMIDIAMGRNKIPYKDVKIKDEKNNTETTKRVLARQLTPNVLYTFSATMNNFTLEEERTLTEKKPPTKTNTSTASKTIGFGKNSSQGATYKEETRKKKDSLGNAWANGLKKADKDFRGLYAVSDYVVRIGTTTGYQYYAVCKLFGKDGKPTGGRVEIYPRTIEKYDEIKALHDKSEFQKPLVYRIACRPRLYQGQSYDALRLSDQYAKLVSKEGEVYKLIQKWRGHKEVVDKKVEETPKTPHNVVSMEEKAKQKSANCYTDFVKGYGGVQVPRWELMDQLSYAGQCCSYCGKVVDCDDHDEIYWVNRDTILCYDCSNDQMVHEQLRGVK